MSCSFGLYYGIPHRTLIILVGRLIQNARYKWRNIITQYIRKIIYVQRKLTFNRTKIKLRYQLKLTFGLIGTLYTRPLYQDRCYNIPYIVILPPSCAMEVHPDYIEKAFEPPHDKTNKMTCPQGSLRSAWVDVLLESSQCAQWVAEDPVFLHADSED